MNATSFYRSPAPGRIRLAILGFVGFGFACLGLGCQPDSAAAPPFDRAALVDLSYPNEFAEGGMADLQDGHYVDDATGIEVYLDTLAAYGDFTGDSGTDAAVLVVTNPGGSGTFVQLAAVENVGGAPMPTAHVQLGDRVEVQDLRIEDGLVLVTMLTQAPNDPFCCPSLRVQETYQLREGTFTMIDRVDLGRTMPTVQDSSGFNPLAPADTVAVQD